MTHDELLAKIVEKEPATLTYSDGEIWSYISLNGYCHRLF